jgi:hypothetical protein
MASIKYDTLTVFVGPDTVSGNVPSGDIKQLNRIQSTNYQIELQRENVRGLGTAYANDGRVEAPFVNLTIDYLVTNGRNEKTLGFAVDGEHGSYLNLNSGERDFFIQIKQPSETPMVLAIGNGMLTRYSVNASVGEFVKATAEIRGFNLQLDEGTSGNVLPRLDYNGNSFGYTYQLPPYTPDTQERDVGYIGDNIYVAPHHLDIYFPNNMAFGTILSGSKRSHLQNFTLSINAPRDEITRIGERYPFKRCLQLPAEISLSANVVLDKLVADKIQNYFCQEDYDVTIDIRDNSCQTTNEFWESEQDTVRMKYMLRGLKLKSIQSSDSIGERKNVAFEWSVPIGNILNLNRNLFMSGNYGRYLFPLDSSREVSGENVTGQNLRNIVREVKYKRTKVDVKDPDFNVDFSGNFTVSATDPDYAIYYQGSSGVISGSGVFGQELTVSTYPYNSDSYNTVYNGLPANSVAKKFATFYPKYAVGYPGWIDRPSGQYSFVTKGEGFNTEPVEISFANIPTWIDVGVEYSKFSIDPYKPYFFNTFNFAINDVSVPTGLAFEFQMIARNSKFRKIYTLSAQTPYSFHITLPDSIKKRTSLFLEPYDETTFITNPQEEIQSILSDTYRADYFSGISGSGFAPTIIPTGLNNKHYIHIESGANLIHQGPWLQDFRNFTFFAVYKPSLNSISGAALLQFYHQGGSGLSNTANAAFFGRKALSQDLEFYYTNASGTSGLSPAPTNHLNVTSTWDTNNWNIATITFDGAIASGRRNGVHVSSQSMVITNSGYFSHVVIGSGMEGSVAEMILLPYKLLPDEVVNVENYLKYKWGL